MSEPRTLLFMDTEFSGLTQDTSLISLALVDEENNSFYAEFSDFKREQCDNWIKDNVLAHSLWIDQEIEYFTRKDGSQQQVFGDKTFVKEQLSRWLAEYGLVKIWADCPAWDWVLFAELFGGALAIPKNVFYMPHDIATLFSIKGLNPDTSRAEFSGLGLTLHNALDDALMIRTCYQKLMQRPDCL